MARPDGRIEPGQSLNNAISARAWNRAQDAADRVLGAHTGIDGVSTSHASLSYTTSFAWNSSGRDVEIGDVMELSWQAQDTQNYDYEASAVMVLNARSPSVDSPCLCVAVEPIKQYKVGRVAVSGLVLAKVNTTQVGGAQIDYQTSYPSTITGQGITSSRSRYLSANGSGVLIPSEVGQAMLVSVPINSNGIHVQPTSQPELCVVSLGYTPTTMVRYGLWGGLSAWSLGTAQTLFDINRNQARTSNGVGTAVRGAGGFVAWNNFRELTNTQTQANDGNRLVCCALDLNMEWQVVCVAPNPDINEVVVNVSVDSSGRVLGVTKKKLY